MSGPTTEPRSFGPKASPPSRSSRGREGEVLAEQLLVARGYQVLDRNWRGGRGELDLICRRGDLLVFVEVRSARSHAFGSALESLRPGKLARLRSAGRAWLAAHGCPARACRFDLVALQLTRAGAVESADVIEGIL